MNRIRTVATSVLVTVGLLAGPAVVAAQASTPTMTASERSISVSVLNLLNSERRAHHLKPLRMDAHLVGSAAGHNRAMAARNVMSHLLPGERSFDNRERAAGYSHLTWAGENVAWNGDISRNGVLVLEKMMYGEKAPENGHRLNILNRHYDDVGVAVHVDRAHHKIWLTTDFGSHRY